MTPPSGAQLDLFLDSRAVVLANEIAAAIIAHDAVRAISITTQALAQGHEHPALPMLTVLADGLSRWQSPARSVTAIADAIERLDRELVPAARSALGDQANRFIVGFFDRLSELARGLAYEADYGFAHHAALRLRCADFAGAEISAQSIPDWARTPDAVRWITIARYQLQGLEAARPTLFAYAWLKPGDVERLVAELGDELLARDWNAFEGSAQWETTPSDDLGAWFPAWYLIQHPAVADSAIAPNLCPEVPAAAAAALLVQLLAMERLGNSRALAASRARLRSLNPDLFAAYMSRRQVFHR